MRTPNRKTSTSLLTLVDGRYVPVSKAPWHEAALADAKRQNPQVAGCVGCTEDGQWAKFQERGNPEPIWVAIS